MRERMSAKVNTKRDGENIVVNVDHALDKNIYNYPLTLKTYVPDDWNEVSVRSGDNSGKAKVGEDEKGKFVVYSAPADGGDIILSAGPAR